MSDVLHGVECVYWANIDGDRLLSGWVIRCLCGWDTCRNLTMAETGADFDEHLKECGV